MKKEKDIYFIPSIVLFCLGIVDIIRGFMHTFVVEWSASHIAMMNLSIDKGDQLFLLGTFGISNFLTGIIYILLSKKAKKMTPYVLLIIPISYAIGIIGLKISGVVAHAQFNGKYFMIIYFLVCISTFIIFIRNQHYLKRKK